MAARDRASAHARRDRAPSAGSRTPRRGRRRGVVPSGNVSVRREVVEEELGVLSKSRLKEALRKLERDPEAGKPLSGPLQGCRSLRVGDSRVVYKLQGNNVEVLVIGRRRESEVYEVAATRL